MLESKVSGVKIAAISTTLPIEKKITRDSKAYYVASELQTTSDLGFDAADRIITQLEIPREEIGILLFGSRTPDYRSPNTAAILQGRLGLAIDCICFDTNVGANGFIKMTQVAAAILAKSNSAYALIIVGDTPSKLQKDTVGLHFEISDAATAVLLRKSNSDDTLKFLTHSSGSHFKGTYLKEGGFRDFSIETPYDGSKSENYVVKSDLQDLQDFFQDIRCITERMMKDDETNHLVNSVILENLEIDDSWSDQRTINADASELLLLLENLVGSKLLKSNKLQFISAGEGMAFMTMTMNYIPEVLSKNHTLNFFDNYKISHEM